MMRLELKLSSTKLINNFKKKFINTQILLGTSGYFLWGMFEMFLKIKEFI